LLSTGCYYYSAPELLLAADDVTTAVDLWSAGCIIAEMITGKSLFNGE